MKTKILLLLKSAVLTLAVLAAGPVRADVFPVSVPDPTYIAATSLVTIATADGSTTTSETDGTLTVTFSSTMTARTVPVGWATWGAPPFTEGTTPKVLTVFGSSPLTLTLTFSIPVTVFGIEVEPNAFAWKCVTATFFNGATVEGVVGQNVDGRNGALLAAGTTTGQFTSVQINLPDTGVAIARIRYSTSFYHPAPHSIHGHVSPVGQHINGFNITHHGAHGHIAPTGCILPHPPEGHKALPLAPDGSDSLLFGGQLSEPGFVAAVNEDGSLNGDPDAQNVPHLRAARGRIIQLFGSAEALTIQDEEGNVLRPDRRAVTPPARGRFRAAGIPEVLVGGVSAEVSFSGLAPALPGAWQLNIRIPEAAPVGDEVPLRITYEGRVARSTTIAIE